MKKELSLKQYSILCKETSYFVNQLMILDIIENDEEKIDKLTERIIILVNGE